MRVFVSYSRLDREFALRLVGNLRRCGHNTWIDIENIPKGAAWPDEIDKGLEASDVVVGVMSENSMTSGNVKNEWDWALENKKPFIPVRLRACTVSHRYIRINYIDCASNERSGLHLVCDALKEPKTTYRDTPVSEEARLHQAEPSSRGVDNRARMLQKVHDFWIEGVLEPAKIGDTWLELPAEQRPQAVQPEIRRELHNPDFDAFSLGHDAPIAEVFHKLGRELLILGAPGSGKTMTLLELARDLIARAQVDTLLPIPVVLNLASWAEKHSEKLEDWLLERLFLEYGVPRKLGQAWIENGKLLFLLDGLDEVPQQQRDACVTAINVFWRRYDLVDNGIVVCSRIADYEMLTTALRLESAIVLENLDLAQADRYLSALGTAWDELRAAIPDDAVLREFAESPLLLNIMAVAYRDTPRSQIMGLSAADQKRQLLQRYVARRLGNGTAPNKYPSVKTEHYLHWLAGKMIARRQTVFQIGGLQPIWLDTEHLRRLNRRFSGTLFGAIGTAQIHTVDKLNWTWEKAKSWLFLGLFGGLGVGLLVGLSGGLGNWLGVGLVCGLLCGLLGGLGGAQIEQRTSPNEGIWRSLNIALLGGLGVGLFGGLGVGLFGGLGVGLGVGLLVGLFVGLEYGGSAVIQHMVLRRILFRAGDAPLNYAEFLDYCASRHLMRRVGGGYIFRHRMLMEYFAQKKL